MIEPGLLEQDLAEFFANIQLCRDKAGLTHGLHPYPAKFIPHIPRRLIAAYARPHQPVLDPMCGSGTTVVEAAVAGRQAIGADLNPIATLVTSAKTLRLSPEALRELESFVSILRARAPGARRLCADVTVPEFHNREKWFGDQVARELAYVLVEVRRRSPEVHVLALAAVSAVIVGVSNQESETRWCAKPKLIADGQTLIRLAGRLENAISRSASYGKLVTAPAHVLRADARALPFAAATIGTIVTSPPYANSHDYYLYNKLRMFFLGHAIAPVQAAEIGSRNRHSDMKAPIEHYLTAMVDALTEWRRVLAPSGRAVIVVGDAVVRGEFFDMGSRLTKAALDVGFGLDRRYRFSHRQFTSSFPRGFGTAHEKFTHILVFS